MPTIRELFVGLEVDDNGSIDRSDRAMNKLKGVALAIGAAFAGGAVYRGFKVLIEQASAAQESANKFGAVFGDAAGATEAKLNDLAGQTGQSTLKLRDYASQIGALVKPQLGSAEAAGDLAAQMTQLALDAASFNDATPEEALVALRSGLIGSAEPLQRFGVDVRVAAIEQEALRQGITKTYKQMSEGQRIQLRAAAIFRQLGAQGSVGDAARTANDYANAMRGMDSQITQVQATLGALFLPVVTKAVVAMRDMAMAAATFIENNPEFVKFTFILGGVAAAVFGLSVAWQVMGVSAIAAWIATAGPILLVAGLLAVIGVAIAAIIQDLFTMGEGGSSVIGGLIGEFQYWLDELGSIPGAILAILNNALVFWFEFFARMFGASKQTIEDIKTLFSVLADFILQTFKLVADPIGDLLSAAGKALSGDLSGALSSIKNLQGSFGENLSGFGDIPLTTEARLRSQGLSSQQIQIQMGGTVVNAAPGMDENQLAKKVAAETSSNINTQLRDAKAQLVPAGGG